MSAVDVVTASEECEPVPIIDETAFRNLISGRTTGLLAGAARGVLRVASAFYGCAVAVRNQLYDRRLTAVSTAGVPVISVGNLTTGGTGKTPVAALICQRLQQLGRTPGLISRGYKAAADGSNDEKRVLELLVPGIPHIQQADRAAAVRQLLQLEMANRPDVVVMDDGFQHRRLHRDLNLVLIDATCPFGFGAVLPRGLLREPLTGLRRADAVLLTRTNLVSGDELRQIEQRLQTLSPALSQRILQVNFEPVGLRDQSGQRYSLDSVRGQHVFLMTAIGNPDAFRTTCLGAGLTVVGQQWFPDHHHYTPADLATVQQHATAQRAAMVITTVKDLVKLSADWKLTLPLALDIEAMLPRAEDDRCLYELLRQAIS
ncbi:MAG: tetraacyldisaccharide 4'-kinase [Planctomycetota bacterium]